MAHSIDAKTLDAKHRAEGNDQITLEGNQS